MRLVDRASALFEWIRRRFSDGLIDEGLDENFRAQSEVAEAALWAGPQLNGPDPDFPSIRKGLLELVEQLPSLGGIEAAADKLSSGPEARAAVLCRTNAEALKVSRKLFELGLRHRLQRNYTDRAVAPWVARVLGEATVKTMGRREFVRCLEDSADPTVPDPDEAWRLVRRLAGGRGDSLDIGTVADRLRIGYVPDELNWIPPAQLVVSTIHRAKGLEFDRVVLLDGGEQDPETEGAVAEETRVLYVALTRPRYDLFRMKRPPTWGMTVGPGDRLYRRGRQAWQVHDIEVRAEDVHTADPAGAFVIRHGGVNVIQDYLAHRVQPGDEVDLWKMRETISGQPRVFYEIRHDGMPIGVTTEGFGASLFAILRRHRYKVRWPERIQSLHVDGVDTVAGTEAAGRRARLGPSGIWLRARIVGLGYLDYSG